MKKKFLKDLGIVTLATAMLGAATCLYIRAGLGSDAVAVFIEGVSVFFGISLGTSSWIFNGAFLVAAFLVARQYIGWTTVFSSLLTGVFVDIADIVLMPVYTLTDAAWYRWIIFVMGIFMVAGSCATMICQCPGMCVMDAVVTRVAEKLGRSFRSIRICFDATLMIVGWRLGGVIGIASVIAVFGTGPLIQFLCRFGKKT